MSTVPLHGRSSAAPQHPAHEHSTAQRVRHAADAANEASHVPHLAHAAVDAWERRHQPASHAAEHAPHAPRAPSPLRTGGNTALNGLRVARVGLVASQVPGEVSEAASAIDQARRTGRREDIDRAIGATGTATRSTADLAQTGVHAAQVAHRFARPYVAARDAFLAVTNNPAAARRTALRVARDAFIGRPDLAQRARQAALIARAPGTAARSTLVNAAGRAVAAGRTAATAVARSPVARTLGRMIPGVNIAIAVADTARAYADWRDPNASVTRRVTSTITAAGSWMAATNVPVVREVGAVVSAVSSFVGWLFG